MLLIQLYAQCLVCRIFTPSWLDIWSKSPTTFTFSAVLSLRVHPRAIKITTLDAAHVWKNTRLSLPAKLQCLHSRAVQVETILMKISTVLSSTIQEHMQLSYLKNIATFQFHWAYVHYLYYRPLTFKTEFKRLSVPAHVWRSMLTMMTDPSLLVHPRLLAQA